MDTVARFVVHGIAWGRNIIGLIVRPYETYRQITNRANLGELWYMAALVAIYLGLASVVRVASFRPFLLTRQFLVLLFGVVVNYAVVVVALWIIGKIMGASVRLRALVVGWGYTLVATTAWFMMTSFLYVVVPPPRTTSALGIMFSVAFLVVSATLLWWKIMLSYLTIRFALRLEALRIVLLSIFMAPIVVLESFLMYRLGVFRVPFL